MPDSLWCFLYSHSVAKCDFDIQSSMYNNVVVTGGATLMQGFVERLTNDLNGVNVVCSVPPLPFAELGYSCFDQCSVCT